MAFTTPPLHIPEIHPHIKAHVYLDDYVTETGEPRVLTFETMQRMQVCIYHEDEKWSRDLFAFTDGFHSVLDLDSPTDFEDREPELWGVLTRGIDFVVEREEAAILRGVATLLSSYHGVRGREHQSLAQQAHDNAQTVEAQFPDYDGLKGLWSHADILDAMAQRDRSCADAYEELAHCRTIPELIERRAQLKFAD